jgi:hypothetical protein
LACEGARSPDMSPSWWPPEHTSCQTVPDSDAPSQILFNASDGLMTRDDTRN